MVTPAPASPAAAPAAAPLRPDAAEAVLAEALMQALDALADAGGADRACRIAGQACVGLRHDRPALSRRLDVWLHRMTRRLDW